MNRQANFEMDWPQLLAYITGRVDQELLLRNEYLAPENRILRAKIKGRLQLSDREKSTLAEIARRLGANDLQRAYSPRLVACRSVGDAEVMIFVEIMLASTMNVVFIAFFALLTSTFRSRARLHAGGAVRRPVATPPRIPFLAAESLAARASPSPTRDGFSISDSGQNNFAEFDARIDDSIRTLSAVTAIVLLVGLLACTSPARRAARTDPMVALQYE